MELVHQRRKGECGLACLAMVAGCTIEESAELFKDLFPEIDPGEVGVTDEEMVVVMRRLAMPNVRRSVDRPDWRSAILTVPSLNHLGLLHYVVWDGERYLDPSPGPLRYPDDGPVIGGQKTVCWACAIIWGDK
jgi:hypothetical protein